MKKNLSLPLLALVCTAGCARPSPVSPSLRQSPIAPTTNSLSHCASAPITARWTTLSKRPQGTGTRLKLEGSVDVSGVVPGNVRVSFRLPEGTVAMTPTILDLGALSPGTQTPIQVELDYASTPGKDLFVEINARDGDAFAHVSLAYRFGRPTPEPSTPHFDGAHVVFNGVDLGPSVSHGIVASPASTSTQ